MSQDTSAAERSAHPEKDGPKLHRWAEDAIRTGAAQTAQAQELAALRAENARLRKAVLQAAFQFRFHADLHEAKGTSDGLQKAVANRTLEQDMLSALTAAREREKA